MSQRRLAGFPLLAVLALFVLPFITVSCEGDQFLSVTGYDMVVGGNPELSGRAAGGESQPVDIEPFAVIAVIAAAIGALAAFAALERRLVAVIAVLGAAALIGLKLSFQADIDEAGADSGGVMSLSFAVGYWLSLGAFGGAAVLALWKAGGRDDPRPTPP